MGLDNVYHYSKFEDSSATFHFNITTRGVYEVLITWSTFDENSEYSPFYIFHNGIEDISMVLMNQQINGDLWNLDENDDAFISCSIHFFVYYYLSEQTTQK